LISDRTVCMSTCRLLMADEKLVEAARSMVPVLGPRKRT